jgi:hypothetical protein
VREVDDGPRTVTIGGGRRRAVVIGAGTVLVAALALTWSGGSDPAPSAAPAPSSTTTIPRAEPVPALAGERLLLRSGPLAYVVDLGSGRFEPVDAPPPEVAPAGPVLAARGDRVAVVDCDEQLRCVLEVVDDDADGPLAAVHGVRTRAPRVRARFSPDGGHLAYYLGEEGPDVTLWRIRVVDLETGATAEAGPVFHDTFVVLDGGRYVVSPSPAGLVVSDTSSGELVPIPLGLAVDDVEPYP